MLAVTVRFLSSFVAGLVAFFLAVHLMHAVGAVDQLTLLRVQDLYRRMVSPILSMDRVTAITLTVAAVALALQTVAVGSLFRRWAYRPVAVNEKVARAAKHLMA